MTLNPVEQALWANEVARDCLLECGGDVNVGLVAADLMISTLPMPDKYSPRRAEPERIEVALAFDIHNRKAQGVLNRSLEAARQISEDARRELKSAIKKSEHDRGVAVLKFVEKYKRKLADLLTSTQLAALLEGARDVATDLPTLATFAGAVPPPPSMGPKEAARLVERLETLDTDARAQAIYDLPPDQQTYAQQALAAKEAGGPIVPPAIRTPSLPGAPDGVHLPTIEEAVKYLSDKNVMTRDEFDLLDGTARTKALAVAGVEAEETLVRIRDALAENVRGGAGYASFQQKVMEAVDAGTFLSDAHQETVFRTNVQSAFSDGQMAVLSHPLVRTGFPYTTYDPIHDDRVRPEHLKLDKLGISGSNIYRTDDPVFQLFRPPWDYNCRCGWTPITVRHAAGLGVGEAQQWLESGVEPSPPAYVPMPDFRPPEGFQRAVAGAPLSIRLSLQPLAAFAQDPPKRPAGETNAGSSDAPKPAAGGAGVPADVRPAAPARQGVEGEAPGAIPPGAGKGGEGTPGPAGPQPSSSLRPAHIDLVRKRIEGLGQWANNTGKSYIHNWLQDLKKHIETHGPEQSLQHMPTEGTPQGRQEPVGYDPGEEYAGGWNKAVRTYLEHHGIHSHYDRPELPVVSSITPKAREDLSPRPEKTKVSFQPAESGLTNKLAEAKHLPGLESSEDLGKIIGRPVTHLNDEVVQALDKKYGQGQWIVKPYTEDAFAGHGIHFPERVERINRMARNELARAQRDLKESGLEFARDPNTGAIAGIKDQEGEIYPFGSREYRTVIQDAMKDKGWSGALSNLEYSAGSERGIPLQNREGKIGGEGFMAQPAFPALQEDIENRESGHPYAHTEARAHIITKEGKAQVVPYATFYKKRPFPVVFHDEESRAIEKAAHDAVMSVPEDQRQGHVYAPDIIKTPQGYKVVELNPSNEVGSSGHLGSNPLVIDAYVSALQNREPGFVQFIRRILSQKQKKGAALDIGDTPPTVIANPAELLYGTVPSEDDLRAAAKDFYKQAAEYYPRNTRGQFVDKYLLAECSRDDAKAAEVRETLPEDQRSNFDRLVSQLVGGGTVHHPREAPGMAIDKDGDIADADWRRYARQLKERESWEERADALAERRDAANQLIDKVGEDGVGRRGYRSLLKKAEATETEIRFFFKALTRKDSAACEEIVREISSRIDLEEKYDEEPESPEEPTDAALAAGEGNAGFSSKQPTKRQPAASSSSGGSQEPAPAPGGGGPGSSPAVAPGASNLNAGAAGGADPTQQPAAQGTHPSFAQVRQSLMSAGVSSLAREATAEDRAAHNQQIMGAAQKLGILHNKRDKFGHITSAEDVGGMEHQVYAHEPEGRMYKFTRTVGGFGTNKDIHEYLERLENVSRMWPELGHRFEGIVAGHKPGAATFMGQPIGLPETPVQVAHSMHKVVGRHPKQKEIHDWFRKHGWQPHTPASVHNGEMHIMSWRDPVSGAIAYDTKSDNFIKTKAGLVPIDVHIQMGKPMDLNTETEMQPRVQHPA